MKITFDKLAKAVLILSLLLVALSVFYYYVIFLPQKEEARLEQQRQEQLAEELKELKEQEAKEEAERNLNECLSDAESEYHNQWYRECKGQDKLTNRCISLHEMTFEEYSKKNNIPENLSREQFEALSRDERVEAFIEISEKQLQAFFDFNKEKDECSCHLPTATANDIGDYRDGLKDECFKKYPQK